MSNSYIYVCNISARPIIELSGINQHINILYLQWPKLNIRDLFSLLELRREKQKIFVLSGMNLKRVGYLKYLCSNETEFYGTMENYPNEMMDRIRPKDSTYKYIEKPKEKCHRIVQNCKLFKSQGLVDNVDFSIKRLNENIDPNFVSINLGLKREPYIVIHTSQVGIDAKKNKAYPPLAKHNRCTYKTN